MKRAIRINLNDGTYKDLELSKAVTVKTKNEMLNLEKLPDGTWRMIWNESLIEDFTKVVNFEVVREE
jgi:plasmid rolling circle replication initiator protein Rep